MKAKNHFELMAHYNRRLNEQVYGAASGLDNTTLCKDLGAYFNSILGTLNHIMVGDLLWLNRFAKHSDLFVSLSKLNSYESPTSLDEILYQDFNRLRHVRAEIDQIIITWATSEAQQDDYMRAFKYTNSKGISSTRNFGEVVSHFYNHQTHHRGQVSTLLSQLGYDIGVTDFLIDIPDDDSAS